MIEIKNISKKHGEMTVLNNVSFQIQEGQVICLLGPNGAGKSTLINILSGLLPATQGEVLYNNTEIKKILKDYKHHLGIVPQDIALYEDLTARQNIQFFSSLYFPLNTQLKEKCEQVLASVGLLDRVDHIVDTFSGGMKRRLNIACSLVHNPDVIIMDEPTVGIDPQSRNLILAIVENLRAQGKTVLYSTHYMEEVEAIATNLVIMDKGSVIAQGTLSEIKMRHEDYKLITMECRDLTTFNEEELYTISGIVQVVKEGHILKIRCLVDVENLDEIIKYMINQNIQLENVKTISPNLETIFLDMTGRKLRD